MRRHVRTVRPHAHADELKMPTRFPVYAELLPLERHASFVDHLFILRDCGRLAGIDENLFASPFSEVALLGRSPSGEEAMSESTVRWKAVHLPPRFGCRRRHAGLHGWLIGVRCQPLQPEPTVDAMMALANGFDATFEADGQLDAVVAALDGWVDRLSSQLARTERDTKVARPALEDALPVMSQHSGMKICDVAAMMDIAPRTLQRYVRDRTGLAPKRFATVRRFSAALADIAQGNESLAEIAAKSGYSDQAHLTANVVRHAGVSPGRFRAQVRPRMAGTCVRFFQDDDARKRVRLLVTDTDE